MYTRMSRCGLYDSGETLTSACQHTAVAYRGRAIGRHDRGLVTRDLCGFSAAMGKEAFK